MHTRTLTVGFLRSVTADVPNTMEVAVLPLSNPSAASDPFADGAVLVGGTAVKTVLLANARNTVTFELVPSDSPTLTSRVIYRIAWRERYMGRQYTSDFVMPDFDVDFDDLSDLGNVLGGETYVQWSDRGRPGGVAALTDSGQLIDAAGNIFDPREVQRISEDIQTFLNTFLQNFYNLQTFLTTTAAGWSESMQTSLETQRQLVMTALQEALAVERAQRQDALATLDAALTDLQTTVTAALGNLTAKADLVDGKIPVSQLPGDGFGGGAVVVASETVMLTLTSEQVQPGDFAILPDGIWLLSAPDPSLIGSWVRFRDYAAALSVNGVTAVGGDITLTAADVNARPADVAIEQSEVAGLSAALAAKAGVEALGTVSSRLTIVETDPALVRKVGGLIPKAALPADSAFVTASNLVAKKDGTVLRLGSGGGTLNLSDVAGLTDALAAKADTAHTHIPADVTGLTAALADLFSLQNRVEDLESAAPGGAGPGTSTKTSWWSAPAATTDLDSVTLRSPFGFDGTDYYYDPAGAAPGEAVYPYVSPGGHLKFAVRDEDAPADPVYATQAALDGKAAVAHTHDLADVTGLTAALAGKEPSLPSGGTAGQYLRGDKTWQPFTKAALGLGSVDNTADTDKPISTATQAALNTKANTAHTHVLADVTGLSAALTGKADLNALTGRLRADQLPSLGLSDVGGLSAALTGKADLSATTGKLRVDQLPPQALTNVVTVTSRSQMLALTSSQVQQGDICIINDTTADKGSWILTNDTAIGFIGSWTKLLTPDSGAVTVNGVAPSNGNITLTAANVSARPANWLPTVSDVTGLSDALAAKVDTSTYTAGLAGRTTPTDVGALITASTAVKWRADFADTSGTLTLSGPQVVDGSTATAGSVVLLTNQTPATNNGLWQVNAGAWTRTADMAAGSLVLRGSTVIVLGGTAHAATIWQQSQTAGAVGTVSTGWVKVLTAGGGGSLNNLTASTGISKVPVLSGGVTTYDLRLDTSVPRKWSGYVVPSAGNFATVTHNLGKLDVIAWFRDATTRDSVLVGWKPLDANTIQAEFDVPPTSTQYWAVVIG